MSRRYNIGLYCCSAILAIQVNASVYSEARPIVSVKNGQIQGVEEFGMLAFKNIPYAAPPVGELRWRPPQPAKDWEGVRDGSQFGQACIQPMVEGMNAELVPGSEDCLKLNVYAPRSATNVPVMVWFHGGALLVGSATEPYYRPINLVKDGVIVVTVDYRLGKLGFFAPKELAQEAQLRHEAVGNYGIMDQIEALKWVKENIQKFGGDPNNVTIFGESAGGRSVTWLMTSPPAKGLFHRAIAESAQQTPLRGQTETRFEMTPEEDLDAKFMKSVGAKDLKDLRALPAEKLIVTPKEFQDGEFGGAFVDGNIIIGDPVSLFAQGKLHHVPFMIGTNSWDGSFFVPGQLALDLYLKKMGQDRTTIEKLYKDCKAKCALSAEVMSDAWYLGSVKLLADSASKVIPSYAYYFSYLTPNIRASHPGAPHTFEIPYVFGSLGFVLPATAKPRPAASRCELIEKATADLKQKAIWSAYWFPTADEKNKDDQLISKQMSRSWTNFAKTGNPNDPGQPSWPVYNLKTDLMRNFDISKSGLARNLKKDRVDYQIKTVKAMYKPNP